MSTRLISPSTSVIVAEQTARPIPGSTITLDETGTYVTADLTLPLTDVELVEVIDPRDGIRAVISYSIDGAEPRIFDLGVRSREADHRRRTIALSCASDEMLLLDHKPLTEDFAPLSLSGSVRAVVNYVLGAVLPGTTLEASPATDAPATMLDVDNLVTNPVVADNTDGWSAWMDGASGGGARTIGTTPETDVDTFYRVSYGSTAGNESGPFYLVQRGIKEGTRYTASTWIRANIGRTVRLRIEWRDSAGTPFASVVGPDVTLTAGQWTRLLIQEMQAPTFAAQAVITMYDAPSAGTWGAGNTVDVTGLRFGPTNSEPLYWPAGVSAWDFLLPVTAAAQLRLFCDEQRRWRLVPSDYTVDGVVSATPATAREGTDRIDRDGDTWADGVIVRYRWRAQDGTSMEKLDIAGTNGKVQIIDIARPYPGPGAAEFRLNRLRGQGRTQNAVAIADHTAAPGMEARITLPGAADQVGRLQAVVLGLTDGFMELRTRGLTDTASTAYIFGAPGISYDDVPAGTSYDEFDWEAL